MQRIAHAFSVQQSVLSALIYADLRARFSRGALGIFNQILSMSWMVILFSILRYITDAPAHRGMQAIPFLSIGVFSFFVFRTTFLLSSEAIGEKSGLMRFPNVTQLDVAIATAIVNIFLFCAIAGLFFLFYIWFGFSDPISNPIELLIIMIAMGIYGFSLGLVVGLLFLYAPYLRRPITLLLRALFFVSGTFFVIPEMPAFVAPYALYNPLLHLTDMGRAAYFTIYDSAQSEPAYVLKFGAVLLMAGLVCERASREKVAEK
ncbi:ABC transporter permease [Zavarzinia sp.]|uniref:ABC transporter permease n=1 Tax=Zavarzinia sp. TaxID=2027920 RepID=UPI0035699FE6